MLTCYTEIRLHSFFTAIHLKIKYDDDDDDDYNDHDDHDDDDNDDDDNNDNNEC